MDDQNSAGLVTNMLSWWKHPFNTNGSALNWVLFVGLFIVAVWFWGHVLLMITDDV